MPHCGRRQPCFRLNDELPNRPKSNGIIIIEFPEFPERNIGRKMFNFIFLLYDVGYIVKDHSDNERGNRCSHYMG